ncbi:MAG: hypothetical protein EP343_19115 [Deltaproteobacteria bacterium]|nr:MAG: hypothetical protein EP343_19115 [Deltaproteobacteria bacterium]
MVRAQAKQRALGVCDACCGDAFGSSGLVGRQSSHLLDPADHASRQRLIKVLGNGRLLVSQHSANARSQPHIQHTKRLFQVITSRHKVSVTVQRSRQIQQGFLESKIMPSHT